MSDESRSELQSARGLLDRYATQIEHTRTLGLLEILATRELAAGQPVPPALSKALDGLETVAWDGAEADMGTYVDSEGVEPALAAAIAAGLALPRPTRPDAELPSAFRARLGRVKMVTQSWVALGASKDFGRIDALLNGVTEDVSGPSTSTDGGAEAAAPALEEVEIDEGPPPQFRIDVGVDLVPLVDEGRGGNLVKRIRRLRGGLSESFGFTVSPIHLRDDLRLDSAQYRFFVRGQLMGTGSLMVSRLLAIDPGDAGGALEGIPTKEPAFGLPAFWIDPIFRDDAVAKGYTVVDPETVLVTHLGEVLLSHVEQLFGWEELQAYLEGVEAWAPGMFGELVPERLTRAHLHRVLRNLLGEGVGIQDARTLFESLSQGTDQWSHPDMLTEAVRAALGGRVTSAYAGREVSVLTLAAPLEEALNAQLVVGDEGAMSLADVDALVDAARAGILGAQRHLGGAELVVVTASRLRGPLRRALRGVLKPLPAFYSVAEATHLESSRSVGQVSLTEGFVPIGPAPEG